MLENIELNTLDLKKKEDSLGMLEFLCLKHEFIMDEFHNKLSDREKRKMGDELFKKDSLFKGKLKRIRKKNNS